MPRARNGKIDEKREGKVAAGSAGVKDKKQPRKTGGSKRGNKQNRLSVTERVRMGQRIVAMRHAPKHASWAQVSKELGVPMATARRIYASAYEVRLMHQDPTGQKVTDHSLAVLEELVEQIAEMANVTDSESVRLGALKTVAAITVTRIELMAGLGRLPTPTALLGMAGLERMLAKFSATLDEFEVSGELRERVSEIYREEVLPLIEGQRALTVEAGR